MYSQIIKEGFFNLETVPEAKTLTNRGTCHKRLTLMILHSYGLVSSRLKKACKMGVPLCKRETSQQATSQRNLLELRLETAWKSVVWRKDKRKKKTTGRDRILHMCVCACVFASVCVRGRIPGELAYAYLKELSGTLRSYRPSSWITCILENIRQLKHYAPVSSAPAFIIKVQQHFQGILERRMTDVVRTYSNDVRRFTRYRPVDTITKLHMACYMLPHEKLIPVREMLNPDVPPTLLSVLRTQSTSWRSKEGMCRLP